YQNQAITQIYVQALQNLFHHSGVDFLVLHVTWELILDGYSESSYSATPRFAAARLPWFSKSVELHDKVIGHYLNIKHYQ
ncbi:IS1 family transposase, partial [Klebsiella pneumoniae]|uniref:IS1 family transposase n=1 Tax=Klebsiella pneumoniae TaxID=573 RepID=UPI0039EE40B8